MNICPRCGSSAVVKLAIAKQAGAAIGGVSGILRGLSATFISASVMSITNSPSAGPSTIIGRLASAITAALVNGAAGCIAGAKLGTEIDHHVFDVYQCNLCNCSFRIHFSHSPHQLNTHFKQINKVEI